MKSEVRNSRFEIGTGNTVRPALGKSGLVGRRIVVTRARHQATSMAELLREYGAEPLFYPCLDIIPPEDTAPLDNALRAVARGSYDWLLITSANTTLILSQRLAALGLSLENVEVAAVGPKTAASVRDTLRIDVSIVADSYTAEALAKALQPVAGQHILLPQSEIARPVLADELRVAGAQVTAVAAYRTVIGQGGDDVPLELASGKIDAVTFTSSSTVQYFLRRLMEEGGQRDDLKELCLAAIGPVTAETLQEADLPVTVMPTEYTVSGLIQAMDSYFRQTNTGPEKAS